MQAQRVDEYTQHDISSAMKLMETRQSRLSSSDVSADARHTLSYQADTPASRFPSTSNVSPSSLVATSVSSDDNLATKFRHHLLPYHRRQQQMTDVETTAGSGQYRPDLWQATRSPADDATWSPLQRPLTQPPHVLALYGAQIWASLVSSLFADNLTGTSASADVSAATTGARNQRSTTLRRTAVPHGEQATSPSTDEAVPQRNTVANWLLDSPSPSSPSVSATTTAISAAAASETTSAFDAAGRLLEQVRQYRCLFVDGVGNVDGEDRHRRHARVVGGQTTMSGRAADDARAGGFSCCLCLKRHATQGAMKMHAKTHTLPCRCAICGKAFSRPWLLQGHVRTHTGERPFVCPRCQRAFADRSNLRAHLQTHAAVKKYACSRCNKTFSRMSLLVKHMDGAACPPVPRS